jgi:STE24 endopeptidase
MGQAGDAWWLWAFGVLTGFQLLMMVVYPTWIAPMFNRFTPLQDEALAARVRRLMDRCGFAARDLLVMDGSRRSAHANAYFTGLGRAKRVVFFDTLLKSLTPDEVEAVLAHELGHFRHRHISQRLVMVMLASLAGLALLGAASQWSGFYVGLGVQPNLGAPNDGLALALFTLILPAALFLLSPLGAWWSRRQEYQADAYAAAQADPRALSSALIKLYTDNASTLTPDPWYVRFHYSHPPAVQRLAALKTRLETAR